VKNWDAAIKIWEKALNSQSAITRAKALNNIAIAYEILDDMVNADDRITKALEALNSASVFVEKDYLYIQQYYVDLKKREKEIDLINKQLGESK
jgi:tetratricopeptide (TPR) repeat protein